MRKFYYFSKNKLKFIEIKNFNQKFVFLVLFFSIVSSFFVFGGYFILDEFLNPDTKIKALKNQNRELNRLYSSLLDEYESISAEISKLDLENEELKKKTSLALDDLSAKLLNTEELSFSDIKPANIIEFSDVISQAESYLARLNIKLDLVKINYQETEKNLENNKKLYDALPASKPTDGTLSTPFGLTEHPILKIERNHNGIDIVTTPGSTVYSPGAGKVIFRGRKPGFGLTIIIDHGYGYTTTYSHLSKFEVRRRKIVNRGDKIALTGNSGKLSTGPHLYYEVRHNNIALNPLNFIYDNFKLFEIIDDTLTIKE